jgi:hypothetical protein
LLSDFLSKDYFKPLQIANRKHDITAMKITDPRELAFDNYGLMELEDAETGEVIVIDTASTAFRNEFARQAMESNEDLKKAFQLIDLDFIQIRTDKSYIAPLIQFFNMRGKRH